MDKKRIIIAVLFSCLVIGLGYLLYRVFFANPVLPSKVIPDGTSSTSTGAFPNAGVGGGTGTTGTTTTGGGLPTTGIRETELAPALTSRTPVLEQIVEDAIVNPQLTATGDIQFYNEIDGKFYTRNAAGQLATLSDQVFFNVDSVTWSPENKEAIIEYPDGSNIFYNFASQKQVTLPKHWESFSFADSGDKIVAKSMGLSPENRWIVSTNPDGTNVELIEPMGDNADKVTVDWSPNRQVIGFSRTGAALGAEREEVLLVGLNGENFKSMIVEGRGFESKWSTEGRQLVYSVYNERNDFKPELWIVNGEPNSIGTGRRVLNLNTWAHKCTFADERFVYCGVPEDLPRGAGFAPGLADAIPDRLFKIDTQTGIQNEIQIDQNFLVVEKIQVSPDGKKIYISDKHQQGLFEVAL